MAVLEGALRASRWTAASSRVADPTSWPLVYTALRGRVIPASCWCLRPPLADRGNVVEEIP